MHEESVLIIPTFISKSL